IAASASSTAGGLSTSVPEAELFNLPFIFRDLDHCYKVLDGPTGQWLANIVEDKLNCVVLGYWFSGIRNVGVFVESLQQTKRKTIIEMKEIIIRYFN
ncbi:unnamed protein product, partial [marine sediment metagenome]